MHQSLKRSLEILLGTACILIGLVGWILPIIPGFPLCVIGILLVSPHHGKKLVEIIKKGLRYLQR